MQNSRYITALFSAVIIFFMTAGTVYAQFHDAKADSLAALAANAPDSVADGLNNDICWRLRNKNPEIAVRFGLKAIEIAKRTGDHVQLVKGYSFVGVCQKKLDNYDDAREYYQLGIDHAIEYNIRDQIGYGYVNLGNLLIHQNKFAEAELELQKALPVARADNDSAVLGYVLLNLGRARLGVKDFDKAEEYLLKSLDIRTKCKKLNPQCNVVRKNLGDCYAEAGLKKLAYNVYIATLKNVDALNDYDLLEELTINIARYHFDGGRYDSALYYASQSLGYAKHLGSKGAMMTAYGVIEDVYRAKNNYKRLAECYREQVGCNDSIFKGRVKMKTDNFRYGVDAYKKESEMLQLSERKAFSKRISTAAVIILVLTVAALVHITYKNRKVKRLNSELASQKNALAKINTEITSSMHYARRIQKAALSTDEYFTKLFADSIIYYRPKEIISGDWYRIEERLGCKIVIEADCTGHGVPGSLLSMMGISVFKDIIGAMAVSGERISPSQILDRMREKVKAMIAENTGDGALSVDGMDASIAVISPGNKTMSFASANQQAFLKRGNEIILLEGDDMPIGASENEKPFSEKEIPLQKGDAVFMINGGVNNLQNPEGKTFGLHRFAEFLTESAGESVRETAEKFDGEFSSWTGKAEQSDDMTVIAFGID